MNESIVRVSRPQGNFKSRNVNVVNGCDGCVAQNNKALCLSLPPCTFPMRIYVEDRNEAAEYKPTHGGYPEGPAMPLASDAAARSKESLAAVRATGLDTTQQGRILAYLGEAGPKIKDDIVAALGFRASSVTARLNELVKAKKVAEQAMVWNPVTNRNVTVYGVAA